MEMRAMTSRRVPVRLLILAVVPLLESSAGCPLSKGTLLSVTDQVTGAVNKATTTLQNGIDTLGSQSASWQKTLPQLTDQLHAAAKDLESSAAQDIQGDINQTIQEINGTADYTAQLLNRSISYAGTEVQCREDIIVLRIKIELGNQIHRLRNLLRKQNNQPLETLDPVPPSICHVDPDFIDLSKALSVVRITGADLGTALPEVYVVDDRSHEVLVPSQFVVPVTTYELTLNASRMVQANLLGPSSVAVRFKWGGLLLPTGIGVTAGATPPQCGGLGQPCCQGLNCAAGICSAGVCVAPPQCGAIGQPCCNTTQCSAGACASGRCVACGALGQPCCSGVSCSAGSCTGGVCTAPRPPTCHAGPLVQWSSGSVAGCGELSGGQCSTHFCWKLTGSCDSGTANGVINVGIQGNCNGQSMATGPTRVDNSGAQAVAWFNKPQDNCYTSGCTGALTISFNVNCCQ